jgi:branched-chain amino acid transport system permease protein
MTRRPLPPPLLAGLTVIGLLLVTQFVLPGPPAISGRGTPFAVLFQGAVDGLVASLTAVGIVLVYRTLRVISFAQTVIGLAGTFAGFDLLQYTAVPFPLTIVVALALGGLAGAVVGTLLLRFGNASRLVLTVVTIIGAGFLLRLAPQVHRLPFFPQGSELTIQQATGAFEFRPLLPLGGWEYRIGGHPTLFGFREAFAVELALVLLVAVAAFYRFTKFGTALRAIAENPQRASLLGIGVGGLSIAVWSVAGVLSAAGSTLSGYLSSESAVSGFAPAMLLASFCAAVLGRMERLPTTVLASVAIAVGSAAFRYSFPEDGPLVTVILFVLLAGTLLVQQRTGGRAEAGQAVSWSAVEEQRPVPRELAVLPVVKGVRWSLVATFGLLLALVPFVLSPRWVDRASVLCLVTIVTVSLVVLVGWGGQVSLGQAGFFGVGAVVGSALTATVGLPFWLAVPLAAAITGGVALVVGLPALRIPGLFLLPVTFAFAAVVENVLFDERYFGWLLPDESKIRRPTFFVVDFADNTSMYFLCLACLALAIVVVVNLRRSRTGRILIALRDNDVNVQSFGVDVVRTKLQAFAISGALAGFAGAVFVHQQLGLDVQSFNLERSVQLFLQAVFGGVGSVAGALLGSAFFIVVNEIQLSEILRLFVENGGPLFLVFASPGGLIALANRGRDSLLRVVAQRRQLIVPSLFADVDPDALEHRLIPLAEPDASAGLGALPPDERWVLPSDLYRGRDRRSDLEGVSR